MNLLAVSLQTIDKIYDLSNGVRVIHYLSRLETFLERYGTLCADCAVDTSDIDEWFMVLDDVWESYSNGSRFLCVACLEKRMGRTLNRWDFTDCPLNKINHDSGSALLRERLLAV